MTENIDYIYAKLMSPIQNALLTEMLVLGLFFVLYSYVRVILENPGVFKSKNFIYRLILLDNVVLLNVYMITSYFLDYSAVSLQEFIQHAQLLSQPEYRRAKFMFFVMVPLDIITVGFHVSMYATVALPKNFKKSINSELKEDIRNILKNLFAIGIGFHTVSIVWWVTFGIFTNTGLQMDNSGYHLIYTLIFLIGYNLAKNPGFYKLKDFVLVIYHTLIIISIYVFRTMTFIDRLLIE